MVCKDNEIDRVFWRVIKFYRQKMIEGRGARDDLGLCGVLYQVGNRSFSMNPYIKKDFFKNRRHNV